MTDRTWHKGPPPHIGWWNASLCRDATAWRWWDGDNWSVPAYVSDPTISAANCALSKTATPKSIEWTDYYPENARVPRIDPSKQTKSN